MSTTAPIIVKKIKKAAHAHHGGAWKVAYADFVTAMMAFFLLLWLLSATTEEQRRGIADYFTPASVSQSASGAGGLLGGQAVSSPGAMTSATNTPSVSLRLQATSGASDGETEDDVGGDPAKSSRDLIDQAVDEVMVRREQEQFREAEAELRRALQNSPDLKGLAKHLVIDQTPEGLRIQIIDREGRSMFPRGRSGMLEHTRKLIKQVAEVIRKLPNKIAVSGHTDATPFRGQGGYSNWELSSARANASRRELIAAGLPPERTEKVVGRADKDLLVKDDPKSPKNRRISIVLLRQATAKGKAAKGSKAARSGPFKRDWTGPRLR